MPDTAAQLRDRARGLRQCAQRADSRAAYDKGMQEADALEDRARQLEAKAASAMQPAPRKKVDQRRAAQLAKIHVAKKKLGLDDDTYRAMLQLCAGVTSSKDLSPTGLARVLDRLRELGFNDRVSPRHGRRPNPPHSRAAQIGKVEALLADAGRPWAYADAVAQRVCKVDAVAFCDTKQLGKVIAALVYDQKRRETRS